MSVTAVKQLIFTLIHWLLHSLFSIGETFFKWKRRLRRNLRWNGSVDETFDKSSLKIPNHIAIITNCCEKEFDCVTFNVSCLIYWASLLKVQYISVYDVKGLLIKNKKLIEERIKMVQSSNDDKDCISLRNGFKEPYFTVHNESHSSRVIFLSCAEGKQQLVQITKEIVAKRSKELSEKEVTPGDVSNLLRTKQNFPDPDLAIILGPTPCFYGYPPWQLRLTEMINIQPFGKIVVEDFIEVMNRYSKCQQRFGK